MHEVGAVPAPAPRVLEQAGLVGSWVLTAARPARPNLQVSRALAIGTRNLMVAVDKATEGLQACASGLGEEEKAQAMRLAVAAVQAMAAMASSEVRGGMGRERGAGVLLLILAVIRGPCPAACAGMSSFTYLAIQCGPGPGEFTSWGWV